MPVIKTLTQFDFYPELESTDGLSLIYFSAQACSSCKHLSIVLSELAKQEPALSIFNVDAQQDQALTKEYEIFHLPALFLFRDGHFHSEIQAEARGTSILKAIDDACLLPAEEAP